MVVPNKSMVRWVRKPIHLGGGSQFVPLVLGPSGVPVITDLAQARVDPELYFDLIHNTLSEAARRALQAMDPAKYEYQSEFARRYYGKGQQEGRVEGRVEGLAKGRADLLARQLTRRFGPLSAAVCSQLASATIEELDAIGERVLSAQSLAEALG